MSKKLQNIYVHRNSIALVGALAAAVVVFFVLVYSGSASGNDATPQDERGIIAFNISPGDGLNEISASLKESGAIRSGALFKFYAVITGAALSLKPGAYEIQEHVSLRKLVQRIVAGEDREVVIAIPEGVTIVRIDALLSEAGVISQNALIDYSRSQKSIEGYLFPDTYRFFIGMEVEEVVQKMRASFTEKALPLLQEDEPNSMRNLILASILEKEVPDYEDRTIVAGILLKRLSVGMPLQVDASICYIKEVQTGDKCYPLRRSDLAIDSRYNTYKNNGIPPLPISNPGQEAIRAVLDARQSEYWFYLSDPDTKKTIFSSTLDEHNRNRVKYLNI